MNRHIDCLGEIETVVDESQTDGSRAFGGTGQLDAVVSAVLAGGRGYDGRIVGSRGISTVEILTLAAVLRGDDKDRLAEIHIHRRSDHRGRTVDAEFVGAVGIRVLLTSREGKRRGDDRRYGKNRK